MRTSTFIDAYRPALATGTKPMHPALEDLVSHETVKIAEQSREWSHEFGVLLDSALSGTIEKIPQKKSERFLDEYVIWATEKIDPFISELITVRDNPELEPEATSKAGQEMQHSGFHLLNMRFAPLWVPEMSDVSQKQSYEALRQAEHRIAFGGTWLTITRERQIGKVGLENYIEDNRECDYRFLESVLAEFDTALVLLEIAKKRDKDMLVMPAPAQFEYLSGSANSDLIAQNRKLDTAIGIQVKGNVTAADVSRYDQDRVVLVDAQVDLGSIHAQQMTKEKRTQVVTFKRGGLLCMEFYRRQKLTLQQMKEGRSMQFAAQQRTRGVNPFLDQATKNVAGRVLPKLEQ